MPYSRLRDQILTFLFIALLCSGLSACGLKGPLVLPPSDTKPMPITPQQLPEPETTEPESEKVPLGILPGNLQTLP